MASLPIRVAAVFLALPLAACGSGSEPSADEPAAVADDAAPDEDDGDDAVLVGSTMPTGEPAPDLTQADVIGGAIAPDEIQRQASEAMVGMSLADASEWAAERNLIVRVVQRDGEPQIVTEDFIDRRVNVVVEAGLVIAVGGVG